MLQKLNFLCKNCFRKFLHNHNLPLLLPIFIFIIARINFISSVPIWDSESVSDCVLNGLVPYFQPLRFNCHHPSMGYLGLLALFQMLDINNQMLLNIANLVLAVLALYCFGMILKKLLFKYNTGRDWNKRILIPKIELGLMILVLAFNPLFFTLSINPNLDFGVSAFFLISLYALVYDHISLTILSLTLLTFSKEPGILLTFVLAFAGSIRYIQTSRINFRHLTNKVFKQIFYTAGYFLPILTFGIYYIYQTFFRHVSVLWRSNYNLVLNFAVRDQKSLMRTVTRLIQAFILNFQWVLTVIILVFLVVKFIQILKSKKAYFNLKFIQSNGYFWFTIFVCFTVYSYFIFLLNTYVAVRYVVPLVPLIILFAFYGLKELINSGFLRVIMLLFIWFLFFIQTFRTVDPVSILIFGTVPFGQRQILRMTRFVNECCGIAGQDQITYNTEYLAIDHLVSKFYKTVNITSTQPIIVSTLDLAKIFFPADIQNKTRTLKSTNIIVPAVYIMDDLKYMPSAEATRPSYLIYAPWNDKLDKLLDGVKIFYQVGEQQQIDYQGFSLYYYPLTSLKVNNFSIY